MPSEKNENRPRHLSERTVYEGFFNLKTELMQHPDGTQREYTSVCFESDAAVILAQDCKGRYILNREYRPPIKQWVLGAPGGSLLVDEDPLVGAKREFFEETGYRADDMRLLGSCYPVPGICSQTILYYYAKGAVQVSEQTLDPFEFIETVLLTEQELLNEIRRGLPTCGLLCTALWYKSLFMC